MAQNKTLDARIRWKRDTSANWTSNDPVLLNGEIIIVDTANGETRFKIGDGTKTYSQLPFEDEVIRNLINNLETQIEAIDNHSKTIVSVSQSQNSGNKIGTITVDGNATDLYAPVTDLSDYAKLASPTFTGTPKVPTAAANNNSTQIATTAYADRAATNAANSLKDSLTSGTTTIIVKEAEHATNADNATTATTASGLNATGIAQVQDIKVNSAAAADTATKATTASGLDSTGIAQVKGIKVNAATAADTATTATTANKTTGTLTIDVNGTSTAFNGSGNQTVNINATALGLSGAMNFRGVVSSLPTTGNANGDVVLNGNKEYVWDGDNWVELGDESSHALKTVTITAGSGLTGGGTLEANRTISHADTSSQASVTASGRRYITGVTLDTYGHVTGLTTGTETVTAPTVNNGTLTIQKNGTNVATFSANQSTAATANITVPTKVSELTNDSGFTANAGTITAVKANGTSVATSGEANIPAASTSAYGVTKLSSATNSTSTTLAATASAVKAAYDLAASKTANAGTVTSVSAGTGLTGGPITSSGSLSLASGVCTAGTYGPTANVSGTNGTTIKVPQITVDTYGRVTGVTERTYTSVNTDSGDTKMTQAYGGTSTYNASYPMLLSATSGITSTSSRGATTSLVSNKIYGNPYSGRFDASTVYGAVWNDYAEYREGTEDFEPGRVICENGNDTLSLATERLQPGANVVSDTFGFAIGETEKAKTPIAVSGRVLVYPYEDRNSYKPGDAVCAAPGGTVSKMTREEIREYPERILGTVSAIPTYERWGEGNVPVNGRIWIKVR